MLRTARRWLRTAFCWRVSCSRGIRRGPVLVFQRWGHLRVPHETWCDLQEQGRSGETSAGRAVGESGLGPACSWSRWGFSFLLLRMAHWQCAGTHAGDAVSSGAAGPAAEPRGQVRGTVRKRAVIRARKEPFCCEEFKPKCRENREMSPGPNVRHSRAPPAPGAVRRAVSPQFWCGSPTPGTGTTEWVCVWRWGLDEVSEVK